MKINYRMDNELEEYKNLKKGSYIYGPRPGIFQIEKIEKQVDTKGVEIPPKIWVKKTHSINGNEVKQSMRFTTNHAYCRPLSQLITINENLMADSEEKVAKYKKLIENENKV